MHAIETSLTMTKKSIKGILLGGNNYTLFKIQHATVLNQILRSKAQGEPTDNREHHHYSVCELNQTDI